MKRNTNVINLLIVVAVTLLAGWYLYPTFKFYSMTPDARFELVSKTPAYIKKVLNLGLDLQGGMRLVLEIDRSKLVDKNDADVLDRAYTVIENRINGLGVAEPSIQKQGSDRLIIELPGLKNEKAAKGVLGSTALLEFNLLREPAELDKAIRTIDKALKGEVDDSLTAIAAKKDTAAVKTQEKQKEAERLFTGAKAMDTTRTDSSVTDSSENDVAAATFSEYLVAVGSQIGVRETDKPKVDAILVREDVKRALDRAGLSGSMFLWGHDLERQKNTFEFRPLYYLKKKSELTGDIIKDAQWEVAQGGMEAGQAVVNLEMNGEGARKFARVTGANVNKFLAIILDNTVYSAPTIRQKISQGRAQITGSFTSDDAKALAVVLRAGALPAPVVVVEERTVGASLGNDSIRLAAIGGVLGLILVFSFMVVYYKRTGLIANFALLLNGIFTLAIMASIGTTMTLPGVAGLVLALGIAIDANVLINERIREELSLGKTIRSAISAGYDRAFVVILDSNLTTILTCIILFWFGTGPIKGFAVTMIICLFISLFTSLFVTHRITDLIIDKTNPKQLSI
jgi:protein-export membrane protein SecD